MLKSLCANILDNDPEINQQCLVFAGGLLGLSTLKVLVAPVAAYSSGTDFSRQNLTSVDVRFWLLKSIPAL